MNLDELPVEKGCRIRGASMTRLETFADAVISLEYYLDAVKTDKKADDSVLEVAEESLEALGHAVAR